jgi:uncharacterized iron-regulated membrane protein
MRKQTFLKLHRWVGLALALFLVIQGATGMTMVFRDEIEPVIHPELIVQPLPVRLPVQTLVDVAYRAHPDATLTRAEFPARADQAVLFKFKPKGGGSQIFIAIDPFRATIVRDGPRGAWPLEWLFEVHEGMLAGPIGEKIVGCWGLGLLFIAITGPIVWWPGRKRLKQGLRVRLDGSTDARWRTLHRSVGAIVAVLFLLLATTGVLMVWKEPVRWLIGGTPRPTPTVALQPNRAMLPVDTLITQAERSDGPAPLRQLRFSSGGRVVAVFLSSNHSIRPDGTAQLYYDAYDGRQLGTYVAGELPASSEFVDWLYTVHTGLWGGLLTRVLLLLTGALLVGMGLTGPWLWYSRTSRKRKRPAQRAPASKDR